MSAVVREPVVERATKRSAGEAWIARQSLEWSERALTTRQAFRDADQYLDLASEWRLQLIEDRVPRRDEAWAKQRNVAKLANDLHAVAWNTLSWAANLKRKLDHHTTRFTTLFPEVLAQESVLASYGDEQREALRAMWQVEDELRTDRAMAWNGEFICPVCASINKRGVVADSSIKRSDGVCHNPDCSRYGEKLLRLEEFLRIRTSLSFVPVMREHIEYQDTYGFQAREERDAEEAWKWATFHDAKQGKLGQRVLARIRAERGPREVTPEELAQAIRRREWANPPKRAPKPKAEPLPEWQQELIWDHVTPAPSERRCCRARQIPCAAMTLRRELIPSLEAKRRQAKYLRTRDEGPLPLPTWRRQRAFVPYLATA